MASTDDVVSVQQQGVLNLGLIYQAIKAGFPNWVTVPILATSTGTAGQVAYDATHFYVCVATNTWVRVALATF